MSFGIKYSKSRRMIISGLCCDCPFEHRPITQDIYIGSGVLDGIAAMVKRRDMGSRLVLIADKDAFAVAGERTMSIFADADYSVTPMVIDDGAMADEADVGRALLTMRMDTDFFVSLGAGRATDITRIVASQTERPMATIASAPSTATYPSVVSKASVKGFVSAHRTVSPEIVVCDMDIISRASKKAVCAGFTEMMSKYLSVADWRVARLINCDKLCQTYAQALVFAANRVLEQADDIAANGIKGLQTLTESLIVSGLIVAMTGSTRAIESTEHAMADDCVMGHYAKGLDAPDYGDALAQSVAYCLHGADRVRNARSAAISQEALSAFDLENKLIAGYGDNAESVAKRWHDTSKAFVERQTEAFVKRFQSVKNALGDIPPSDDVISALKRMGCLDANIDADVFAHAEQYAAYLTGFCGIRFMDELLSYSKD